VKAEERLEKIGKLLEKLKDGWIFVEGKRDKEALTAFGFDKILTISGNLRLSCDKLSVGPVEKVYVLTDLDRRGDELAKMARDELESRSIRADIELRTILAHMLRIRCFEDARRAYDKIKEEYEEGPKAPFRRG